MGYKSEVAIQCEEKAAKMIQQIITDAGKDAFATPDTIYKDNNPNNECDQYIFHWGQIEWYNDETIDAIMKTLQELDDHSEEEGYGYKFIRLGEDVGDVSTKTNDSAIALELRIYIPEGLEEVNLND